MKKTSKVLLVALPLLTLSGMLLPSAFDNGILRPVFLERAAEAEYAIQVEADEAVTVNVATSALENSRVNFNLEYNTQEYLVTKVLVNEDYAVKNAEKNYSFVMPDQAVSLVVEGQYLSNVQKYNIRNANEEDGILLDGAAAQAAPGDTVSFKVEFAWDSPYSFNNKVEVYKVDADGVKLQEDAAIEVSNGGGSYYSFVMPENNVEVSVGKVAKKFSLEVESDSSSYISKIEKLEVEESSEILGKYAKNLLLYGKQIKVTLEDSAKARAKGLILKTNTGEQKLYPDDGLDFVLFSMPASNVELSVETEVNYKSITIQSDDKFTIQAVKKAESGDEYEEITDLTKFIPTEYVYLKVTNTNDNYALKNVKISYGSSSLSAAKSDDGDDIYFFTMPDADDVSISVESVEIKFKDYEFLGSYVGNNIYNVNLNTAIVTDSYNITIDNLGNFTKGSSSSITTKVIETASAKTGDGTITFDGSDDSAVDVCYGGKFIFANWNFSKKLSDAFGQDYLVDVKKENENDANSQYSFRYVSASDKSFVAIEALHNGEHYASMFFDATNKKFYAANVTFEVEAGKDITSVSSFTIKVGQQTIGTVTDKVYAPADAA